MIKATAQPPGFILCRLLMQSDARHASHGNTPDAIAYMTNKPVKTGLLIENELSNAVADEKIRLNKL